MKFVSEAVLESVEQMEGEWPPEIETVEIILWSRIWRRLRT